MPVEVRGFPPIRGELQEAGSSTSLRSAQKDGERGMDGLRSLFPASVVGPKFVEEQPQILRLATPELKDVRGPVRSE
jgi:hypothetical protein